AACRRFLPFAAKYEGNIMVEEKVEPREINWRHLLPWTAIFQGFRVALDLNKLLLAALGILAMALVWWLLAVLFIYDKPHPGDAKFASQRDPWASFKEARQSWNLMHEAAGDPDSREFVEPEDLAGSQREAELIKNAIPVVASESAS